jgi:hypothetical protein
VSRVKPEPLALEVALAHYVASLPEGKSVSLEDLAGTWELSGGVGLCGYCGSRLRTRSPNNSTRKYFYYTCLNES